MRYLLVFIAFIIMVYMLIKSEVDYEKKNLKKK